MKSKTTLVIGASENPERYSNKAIKMLKQHNHEVLAYGLRNGEVAGVEIDTELPKEEVDTVTLYVGPKNQGDLVDQMKQVNPRRVIFNPGTENAAVEKQLIDMGIKTTQACTLVLLSTDQYDD